MLANEVYVVLIGQLAIFAVGSLSDGLCQIVQVFFQKNQKLMIGRGMNGSPAAKAQLLPNLFLFVRFVFLPAFSPCHIALLFGNDLRIVRQAVFLQLLQFSIVHYLAVL